MSEPETVEPVVTTVDAHGVATVRINRPDAMNALDTATKTGLVAALESVAADPAVRCVVLTGTGPRAFSVGQDLRQHIALVQAGDAGPWRTVRNHYNRIVTAIATMPKPVVASVNGVAAGAGASFALACDFRVFAETAGINMAFTGIGLSCDSGASWSLPRLVGAARALDVLMRPRTIPAAECLSLGLATEVVPPDELETAVGALASSLATGPTLAYAAIRRLVRENSVANLGTALEAEAEQMERTGTSQDHLAAVAAFIAKEQPTFTGS